MEPYTGLKQNDWDQASSTQKLQAVGTMTTQMFSSVFNSAPKSGQEAIVVNFKQGHARMWPGGTEESFTSSHVYLSENSCQSVNLTSKDHAKSTNVYVCYKNQVLQIDPSRWNHEYKESSLNFHKNVVWDDGADYTGLNSSGYAGLSNVTVSVQTLDGSE